MFSPDEARTQLDGMGKQLDGIQERAKNVRAKHVDAKIKFERLNQEIVTYSHARFIELATKYGAVTDPTSGKPNAEWSRKVIESELEQDSKFVDMMSRLQDLKEEAFRRETDLEELAVENGNARAKLLALGALLHFASSSP